jgi:hypothetical protein
MSSPPIAATLLNSIVPRTVTLATTVQTIAIPREVWGICSGFYLTIDDATANAGGYQILSDGGNAISSVAPTADYYPLYGRVGQPVSTGVHNPAEAAGGTVHIMVWAASGTPVLSIQPIPVGR